MTASLLVAEDLRVDVEATPAVDGLAFTTKGERVLVLGAPRALFLAAAGILPVTRGALRVRGRAPVDAVKGRTLATCAFEPPQPPAWTVTEYVVWSARLAGLGKSDARVSAAEAITKLGLEPSVAAMKLGRAPAHVKRATGVAAALATGASVIAFEDPLAGLAEEEALPWGTAILKALEGRAFIVFAARMALTSPFALAADDALVVSATTLDAQGLPPEIAAATQRFRARVHGPVEELVQRLAARGVSAQVDGAQVAIDLANAITTAELLALCAETQVAVVELVPTARALA